MALESRRDLILNLALEMMAERGIAGLSTRELSRRAGLSEALIFHHFGTKAGLVAAAARSGDTLLARLVSIADGPPPSDLGAVIERFTAEAVDKMRPGSAGRAFGSVLMSGNPKIADVRAEGLAQLDQARNALAAWMERAPHPPHHGGSAAARTLLEGVLWQLATLPDDPEGWDAAAPVAFAELAARWRALHLED